MRLSCSIWTSRGSFGFCPGVLGSGPTSPCSRRSFRQIDSLGDGVQDALPTLGIDSSRHHTFLRVDQGFGELRPLPQLRHLPAQLLDLDVTWVFRFLSRRLGLKPHFDMLTTLLPTDRQLRGVESVLAEPFALVAMSESIEGISRANFCGGNIVWLALPETEQARTRRACRIGRNTPANRRVPQSLSSDLRSRCGTPDQRSDRCRR